MYKLMVVDDEQIAIDSIEYLLENEFPKVKICNTAKSGREAIEKVRIERPDIILMDIRMPGINGLETIQQIKKIHNNVKFIIISAYEYFEFAKQAVELGVEDYLTKPVNKLKLFDTLEKIIIQIEQEMKMYNENLAAKEKLEEILPVAEHSFIYSILYSQGQKINFKRYKNLFDIDSDRGSIFILKFDAKNDQQPTDDVVLKDMVIFFKDRLKYKMKSIVGPLMFDRIIVYISENSQNIYEQRVELISLLETIVDKIVERYSIHCQIGIGSFHDDDTILQSYQEALRALNYSDNEKVVHIEDIAININKNAFVILPLEQDLINAIERGDTQGCINILSEIFTRNPEFFEKNSLRNKLIEIMVVAHRLVSDIIEHDETNFEYGDYLNHILNCDSKEKFRRMYIDKISSIAKLINETQKKSISNLISKANKIIENRFSEDLTLDDISKELSISPQYFSKLYKDEMGVNFKEQLTKIRIEYAKKLIKGQKHSIKDICYMSGYNDPNYFSRIFKKYQGITPSAYAKKFQ